MHIGMGWMAMRVRLLVLAAISIILMTGLGNTLKPYQHENGQTALQLQNKPYFTLEDECNELNAGSCAGLPENWALGQTLTGPTGSIYSVSFSPDGNQIASGSVDTSLRLYNSVGKKFDVNSVQLLRGHSGPVKTVAFSPDGKFIASGSVEHGIIIYNPLGNENLYELKVGTLRGHTDFILSLSFSPDGTRLASSSADNTIRIWNTSSWQLLETLASHSDDVLSVAFSPDGKQLASGDFDGIIQIWDVSNWTVKEILTDHNNGVSSLAFSPDGRVLASGSADNSIRIWNTNDWISVVIINNFAVNSISMSAAGGRLVAGAGTGELKIWNTEDWTKSRTILAHSAPIFSVSFSNDGKRIASGSIMPENEVRIWERHSDTDDIADWLDSCPNDSTNLCFVGTGKLIPATVVWVILPTLFLIGVISYQPFSARRKSQKKAAKEGAEQALLEVGQLRKFAMEAADLSNHEEALRYLNSAEALCMDAINSRFKSALVKLIEELKEELSDVRLKKDQVSHTLEKISVESNIELVEEILAKLELTIEEDCIEARKKLEELPTMVNESIRPKAAEHGYGENFERILSTINRQNRRLEERELEIQASAIKDELRRINSEVRADPYGKKMEVSELQIKVEELHKKSSDASFHGLVKTCQDLLGSILNTIDLANQVLREGASTVGQVVDELSQRFEVGELIAEGGMAQVFRATEKVSGQTVVWKQAHGLHNPLKVANQKLIDESELMQIFRHPRIPTYLAHGDVTGGNGEKTVVLVQEFIEGGDLKLTVEQVSKVGASINLPKVIEYILAICEPLEHMASLAEPIYHRDLKPHNIIIHPEHGPVLIDFGLAKMVATGEDVSITRGGSGTWTPPERDAGVSGPFTDVYSLGKILFYLLTNKSPPAILDADNVAPITEAGHPQWLADLTLRAAWPQQTKRIQTVEQFRILLQNEGVWPTNEVDSPRSASSDDYTSWG